MGVQRGVILNPLWRYRRLHRFNKYPEYLLRALVRQRDAYPGLAEMDPTFMPSKWELAHKAGLISSKDLKLVYKHHLTSTSMIGSPETPEDEKRIGVLRAVDENLDAAIREMRQRGWLPAVWEGGIWPSTTGVDYGRMLLRPWYCKVWDTVKADARTVVIAVITAIIITVVTTLILRALGW